MNYRRKKQLKNAFKNLLDNRSVNDDLARDPLRFVRRYTQPQDIEVAAVFSSCLAYGRVTLFGPVIESIMEEAELFGGPSNWVRGFTPEHAQRISHIRYRWNRNPDFALMVFALQGVLKEHDSLGGLFEKMHSKRDSDLNPCLEKSINNLREHALKMASKAGVKAQSFSELPRGFRSFLSRPSDGSACKRWNLMLRWMCRKEHPDLGIWNLPEKKLRIPLDAHVHQISWLLGITKRKQADDKAVTEITAALRKLDRQDPIQFDFSLSHLGISGECQKRYIPDVCCSCPLEKVCSLTPN